MRKMKKLGLVALVMFGLSGCSRLDQSKTPSKIAYAKEEVYQGYPCGLNCEGFKNGYEKALTQGFKEQGRCDDLAEEEKLGCEAYVVDYEYENKSFEELLKNF